MESFLETINKEIVEDKIYTKVFNVKEGYVLVDIGSSTGLFTKQSLQNNPSICFVVEPSKDFIPILKEEFKENGKVKIIEKAISDNNSEIIVFDSSDNHDSITFQDFINQNNIEKIDFLKTDCEGGEYSIFIDKNINWIIKNVKYCVGEWHLGGELKEKFRYFRDRYIWLFKSYQIYSVDGVNITWSVFSEDFLNYYTEVIIHIEI
jgi:FkbM family methyltransferase